MKKLGKNGLKWFKGLHMIAVSCLIGGSVALMSLYLIKGIVHGGDPLLNITNTISQIEMLIFVLPGAIGCMMTGLIYSIFSKWGFFKHNWIVFKWIMAVVILLGALVFGPWQAPIVKISGLLGIATFAAYLYSPKMYFILGGVQVLLLILTVFISTVKPWQKREGKLRDTIGAKAQEDPVYSRKWLVTSAVGMGVFLATLDSSIVNVSLPTMAASLNTNFTIIQWVVLSYFLTGTTLLPGFGRLGDIFGKKKIYLLGFAVFTMSSVLCGFAPNVYLLIGFRIIQGMGAAMTTALGAAILTESFPPSERGKALGIIATIVSIGIVAGPVFGGIIIEILSWHWIFFVNVPIGICGILMVQRFIPDLSPSQKQNFDYLGALIFFVSLICFLMGLSLGQQRGFTDLTVLMLLPAALISMIAFIVLELRIDQPMIHFELFKNPLLSVNLLTGFISFIALGGTFIMIPFYLEVILGYSTMKVGLLMCVIPVMMGIFSSISGNMSDHFGYRPITLMGLVALFFGYFASGTLNAHTGDMAFIIRTFGIGIGMGLFLSPNNSAIMGAGPKNQLGVVSSLMAITRSLGQVVGVSTIGTLWAVRIRTVTGNWELSDVTKAPLDAQVQGLQFIFMIVASMIFVGFCLSVYGFILDRRYKKRLSEVSFAG